MGWGTCQAGGQRHTDVELFNNAFPRNIQWEFSAEGYRRRWYSLGLYWEQKVHLTRCVGKFPTAIYSWIGSLVIKRRYDSVSVLNPFNGLLPSEVTKTQPPMSSVFMFIIRIWILPCYVACSQPTLSCKTLCLYQCNSKWHFSYADSSLFSVSVTGWAEFWTWDSFEDFGLFADFSYPVTCHNDGHDVTIGIDGYLIVYHSYITSLVITT